MTSSAAPRCIVFVIDSDASRRAATASCVRAAGYVAEDFATATQWLARPGVVISGCVIAATPLSDMDASTFQRTLRERNIGLPLILLAQDTDVPAAVLAIKRGASDYLVRPITDSQLLAAIGAAAATGEAPALDALPPLLATLSRREREVLALVLAGGQTRAIAAQLFISVKTVEFHRTRIHAKLGVGSLAGLFSLCLGQTAVMEKAVVGRRG